MRAAFHADLFLMATQLEEVRTTTEVAGRRAEKLVMLGPVLERLQPEYVSPMVALQAA